MRTNPTFSPRNYRHVKKLEENVDTECVCKTFTGHVSSGYTLSLGYILKKLRVT